jgi:hypothetical protein
MSRGSQPIKTNAVTPSYGIRFYGLRGYLHGQRTYHIAGDDPLVELVGGEVTELYRRFLTAHCTDVSSFVWLFTRRRIQK